MTISKDTGSWASLLSPTSEEDVQAYVAGIKTWLLRTGGTLAVREAELVGPGMVVLCGREVLSGHAACVSLPVAEVLAAA
jgi:hypothetical protein